MVSAIFTVSFLSSTVGDTAGFSSGFSVGFSVGLLLPPPPPPPPEEPELIFVQFTVMVTLWSGIVKLMPLSLISSFFAVQVKSLTLIPTSVRSFNVYPLLLPIWRATLSSLA